MAQNIVEIIIKAIDDTKSGLSTPITGLESLSGALGKLSTFFKIGEAAAAFFFERLISHSIESADKFEILHEKTGIAVETLSTMAFAAQQSDLQIEQLALGMKKLSSFMLEAAQGDEKAISAFQALGVSATNADGSLKNTDDVLKQVATGFSKMQDGAYKSALAVQIFGKAGADLIPFLNQGGAGIEALQEKAKSLGLEIGGETAEQAHAFKDALKEIESGVTGFGNEIITWLLPGLTKLAQEFASTFEKGQAMYYVFQTLSTVFHVVWIAVETIIATISTLIKVMADAVAGVAAFFTAIASGGGWQGAKATLVAIKDQIKNDIEKSFDNMSESAKKAGESMHKNLANPAVMQSLSGLKKKFDELKSAFEKAHPGMTAYFNEMDKLSKKAGTSLHDNLFQAITNIADAMDKQLGQSISNVIMGTESLGQAFAEVGQSIVKAIVDYIGQLIAAKVAQAALGAAGDALLGASTATSTAYAGVVAGAWASPAALVSLASFGSNAAPAQAGIASTVALSQALGSHAAGTDLINQTGAYILHKDEAVINPNMNKKYDMIAKKLQGGGSGSGMIRVGIMLDKRELGSAIIDLQRLGFVPA